MVGLIQVLHPVDPQEPPPQSSEVAPTVDDETGFWWTCCAGSAVIASEAHDLHVAPQDRMGDEGELQGSGPSGDLQGFKYVVPAGQAMFFLLEKGAVLVGCLWIMLAGGDFVV
eukprot:symbB.v1.2.009208.t2/scaffold580.1/size320225/10